LHGVYASELVWIGGRVDFGRIEVRNVGYDEDDPVSPEMKSMEIEGL